MKKALYIFAILVVGLYFLTGLITTLTKLQEHTFSDLMISVVMLVLFAWLEVFLIKKYKKSSDPKVAAAKKIKNEAAKREKFESESKVLGSKARQQLLGADLCIKVKHMAGLPIAEGAEAYVYRCPNKIVFERNQDTIELSIDKVRDILIKTDVEIQKGYSSSVGGAVGGYVLFGPLGAMVGGRSKEKKSTFIERYLIFAYINKENNQDYISFDVTNEPKANLFNTNYYNLTKNERVTTSL